MFLQLLLLLIASFCSLEIRAADTFSLPLLGSTASDPDTIIERCVNVINGDFCETVTDLIVSGPDPLILQRFHHATNYVTGSGYGGWRLLPQTLLVMGKDPKGKACKVRGEQFEWTYVFGGERSGAILTYSGWKRMDGTTKDPLKINPQDAIGLVNTYVEEISGQTNPLNNRLYCKGDFCILTLGDGTIRIYEKTTCPNAQFFNQNSAQSLATNLSSPSFYHLIRETLPSGNHILYTYDAQGELIGIEIQNSVKKIHSSVHFRYNSNTLTLETSDHRTLSYTFEIQGDLTLLKNVSGSHCISCTYDYQNGDLIRKRLPEGRFLEITYDSHGRVSTLKKPHPETGKPFTAAQFQYGKGYTDVINALGIKTRYFYDEREELTAVVYFDQVGKIQRTDRKYYGQTKKDLTRLIARTIEDGEGNVFSYRTFTYDDAGNVLEEKLYGNLTGKQDPHLLVDQNGTLLNPEESECHTKTFTYSKDSFNLLTSLGDCKGNQTTYHYKEGTNLLIKKLIRDQYRIRNREYRFYNEDGICIKIIEDDGSSENPEILWDIKERRLTYITPKLEAPGIGLPEIIETKALDLKTKQELLMQKLVNIHSLKGELLSCTTYGSDGQSHYTVSRTYNSISQVLTETDPEGKIIAYTHNACGERTETLIAHENKRIACTYDKLGRLTSTKTYAGNLTTEEHFTYDLLGRKTSEKDRFGHQTEYTYDSFGHLIQVTYPQVVDEYSQPVRPTFLYTYDLFGNPTSITDPKGYITHKSYNLRGSPSKIHYPDGSSELFKYDPEGSLHRSLTRDRLITIYEYDYLGRPTYEEVMTASETGSSGFIKSRSRSYNGFRCTSVRDDQHVIDYTHDPSGRIIEVMEHKSGEKESHPDTRKTEIGYDPLGRKSHEKAWFGIRSDEYVLTRFIYDTMGNLIEKRVEDAEGMIQTHNTFAYDSSGRCTEESDSLTRTSTAYDPFGEPIAYTDASGAMTEVVVDYGNPLKKTIVNPLGLTTEMQFDALQRPVGIIKKDSQGILLSLQEILYDPLGNKCVERNSVIIDGKIQGIQTTRWIYGPMGRLEKLIEAEGSDEEKTTSYAYNALGQLISQTFPNTQNPLSYTYNKEGKLYKVQYDDPDKELCLSNTYSYDRQGNVTSAHALYGISVSRECNIYGQVIKESIKDGEGSYTLGFGYDRLGRLQRIRLPDVSSIEYAHEALFGKEVVRLGSDGSEAYRHTYNHYDTSGRLCEETLIGYCGDRFTAYDASGRRAFVSTDYTTESRTYDALGHILSAVKEAAFEAADTIYAYNALSQLTLDKKTRFAYDSIDNKIQENNEVLLHNTLNQLIRVGHVEYSYDPLGNLKRKVLDGEETVLTHNILSQLISIQKSDRTALYFSYDPFGRRLVKKECDISGKYKKTLSLSRSFYFGNLQLGELDQQSQITKLRVPGFTGPSIAIELSGKAYAPLHDHAGNVIALLDPDTREIIESYTYSAFGRETIYANGTEVVRSAVGNPWRFAEKPIDEESGLIYFGLRYYDPALGRWISQDPSREDGPNLYAYLHNNPINYTDHFGLETDEFEEYYYGDVEKHCYCETHRTCKRGGDLDKTVGSALPTIRYSDTFEQMFAVPLRIDPWKQHFMYEPSKIYQVDGQERSDLGIGFANGMGNDFESARASAEYLSRLAGGYCVHAVYNATHGHRTDLLECKIGLSYIATEPVRLIHQMWNSFFERSSASAKFLMVCHSQGAIHVRNALLDYPPELRKRIIVVAVAPGAYVYQQSCAQVTHYRNASARRDFIPHIDRKGVARSRETIVDVVSHQDAGWFDHGFQSLTYYDAIKNETRKYLGR